MSEAKVCPKCGGAMEAGFIGDLHGLHLLETISQETWVPGEENPKSYWGNPLGFSNRRKVVTYCCADCGFLESYAPKPNAAT